MHMKLNAWIEKKATSVEMINRIPEENYDLYDVRRGLRNPNGTGVLVGLTEVGSVQGYDVVENVKLPSEGKLFYRGYNLIDLVDGFQRDKRMGFEEIAYLLLMGALPTKLELFEFNELLNEYRKLPDGFTENMILKIPSNDIMNKLQRSVLVLYSHDDNPDDLSTSNLLRQSMSLIAQFPVILAYGYQAKAHYFEKKSLFIHQPDPSVGTAENILRLSRPDCVYSKTEAETLDLLLVMHAEHGGGNNSAFATHVVSSSGTDTYSAISAALGCLKGPKHGGANRKVYEMVQDIQTNCLDWKDEQALKRYLLKIINKEAFDGKGLIYGMGHAVYTLSDPRAVLLKEKARELAKEKGCLGTYALYESIERLTKIIFKERKGDSAAIAANVDLYSGFVYEMLDIPPALYTPLFATARVAGWCAHRIEQVISDPKIIRPAYKSVKDFQLYRNLSER
ncbi:MAG: citrate/2-methylcitrate synthase [Clostridia bacterium]|nr:citrate/2-methylcitrate synthase [Clostridia bacterium]